MFSRRASEGVCAAPGQPLFLEPTARGCRHSALPGRPRPRCLTVHRELTFLVPGVCWSGAQPRRRRAAAARESWEARGPGARHAGTCTCLAPQVSATRGPASPARSRQGIPLTCDLRKRTGLPTVFGVKRICFLRVSPRHAPRHRPGVAARRGGVFTWDGLQPGAGPGPGSHPATSRRAAAGAGEKHRPEKGARAPPGGSPGNRRPREPPWPLSDTGSPMRPGGAAQALRRGLSLSKEPRRKTHQDSATQRDSVSASLWADQFFFSRTYG